MSHTESSSSLNQLDIDESLFTGREKSDQPERFVDYDRVLERVAGSLGSLQKLTEMFLSTSTDQLQKLEWLVAQGDCENISNCAHALKGQIAFFTNDRPHSAIVRIEHSAHEKNLADVELAFADLQECWPTFISELNNVVANI